MKDGSRSIQRGATFDKSEFLSMEISNNIVTWPSTLRIDFVKGILLTIFSVLEGFLIWRVLYPKFLTFEHFTPLQSDTIYLFLSIFNFCLVLFIFFKFGNIRLRELVFFQIPTTRIFLKWIYIALGISLFNLFVRFPFGLDAQLPDFIIRHLIILIISAILTPIKEEIVFRGILYGSLRAKFGRTYAFVFSILCFVFAHGTIQALIWQGHWTHFFYFFIFFTIIAFLLVYIYESTYSLLLCIIFHSVSNSVYHIAPLIGFFYGGYTINVS